MATTTNLGLNKPARTDNINVVTAINNNMDALDAAIGALPSGSNLQTEVSGKADKVASPTNGNFAGLDGNGNLTDSGKKAADFATASEVGTVPSGKTVQGQITDIESSIGTVPSGKTVEGQISEINTTVGSMIDDTSTANNKVWSAQKVNDLKSAVNKIIDTGTTFTTGHFINNNGIVSDSDVFAMSGEIKLAKGQTITAYMKSFLNVEFSAIAVKNADGTYTKKVGSKLTATWDEYTYTATDDCIVVLSTYSDSGDVSKATAYIYVNGEDLQKELINIHDNIDALGKYGLQTLSLSFISGKFINHNGAESSNENYKRTTDIPISKNQTIHFYAQGVSTVVSLIAKHNEDGTFTPLIVCTDATPVWSTYKATENCNVVISSNASLTVVAEEYYTKDFFDYVGEKVGEMPDGTNPLKDLRYDGGFTRIFDSIGCIGDSLASGETYSNEGGTLSVHSPNWPISWGDRIAKICNNIAKHFSRGGQTTKTWLEEWASNTDFTDDACKAYIIALGANDSNGVNGMVIGNQSDAETPVVTPGTSFYGNYSQIIRDIEAIQPKAKIFVVTVPTATAEERGFNTAVRYMATYYDNVYVIDLYTYGLEIYNVMTSDSGLWRANHGNSLSYMIVAWHLSTYIDWIIRNNYSEFSQVEYIGTDWSWADT